MGRGYNNGKTLECGTWLYYKQDYRIIGRGYMIGKPID